LRGSAQRALDQGCHQGAAVFAIGVQIVRWVDCVSSRSRGFRDYLLVCAPAVEGSFDRGQAMRPAARANDADTRIAGPALLVFVIVKSDPC